MRVTRIIPITLWMCLNGFGQTAGTIITVAGSGNAGYDGDNKPASSAQLNLPPFVAVDRTGNIYIADEKNHRVRKVDTKGIITTIAGTGVPGYNGDNQPAASAQLNGPSVCSRTSPATSSSTSPATSGSAKWTRAGPSPR